MAQVATTPRLWLREARTQDAPFLFALVSEPGWRRYFGDWGIRDEADARRHIEEVLQPGYARDGFGLWVVGRMWSDEAVGLCGLMRHAALPAPDLVFALREAWWGNGYAQEAARAVVDLAFGALALPRIDALTMPDNPRSVRILEGLGFVREGRITLPGDDRPMDHYRLDRPDPS